MDDLWSNLRLKLRRARFTGLIETDNFAADPAQAHVFGNPDYYQPPRTCQGQVFKKLLFRLVGHMNTDELAVARILVRSGRNPSSPLCSDWSLTRSAA